MIAPGLDWKLDHELNRGAESCDPVTHSDSVGLGRPRGPPNEMRMSPESVAGIVEPAGFRAKEVVALLPYRYGAVFEALP